MKLIAVLLCSLLPVPLVGDIGTFTFLLTSSLPTGCVDPVHGVSLEGTVTAVDLALDYINSNPDLVPATNLSYGTSFSSIEVCWKTEINNTKV